MQTYYLRELNANLILFILYLVEQIIMNKPFAVVDMCIE